MTNALFTKNFGAFEQLFQNLESQKFVQKIWRNFFLQIRGTKQVDVMSKLLGVRTYVGRPC